MRKTDEMAECNPRTGSRFEKALLELVGKKLPDAGDIFDATSFATAKKTHCKSTEYDENRGNVRGTYNNFPPKFKVVELEFESSDNEEMSRVQATKVTKAMSSTKPKTEKTGIPLPTKVLFPPEHVHLHWQGVKRIGAGLQNLGNTCFLNATLQCLTYTPPLFNYLTSGCHKTECKVSGFCMTCELQNHVKRCFENGFAAIRPDCILRNLRLIAKHLKWGHQEDAHEFLRFLVDALVKSQLTGYERLDHTSKETTVVHQIFRGTLRSQVTCQKCLQKSDKFDPFLDVSIELKTVGSVEMGLKKFVESEILQGKNAYNCGKCKREVEAKKCLTFHTVPNVLVLQFKRSTMMGGKVMRHVVFTEHLNMRPYMSDRHGDSINYRLYAVIVHEGASTTSGHYYCYVRAPNHVWHCMNDSYVRPVGVNQVLNAQAYILFYVKEKRTIPPQLTKRPEKSTVGSEIKHLSDKKPEKTLIPNGLCHKNKPCVLSEKGIAADTNSGLKLQNISSVKQLVRVEGSLQNGTNADKTNVAVQNGVSSDGTHVTTKVLSYNGSSDVKIRDNVLLPHSDVKTKQLIENNGVNGDKKKKNVYLQNDVSSSQSSEKLKPLSQNGVCSDRKPAKTTDLLQNGLSSHKKPGNSKSISQNGICNSMEAKKPNILSDRPSSDRPSSSLLHSNLKCVGQTTNASVSSSPGKIQIFVQNGSNKAVNAKVDYNGTGKWTVVQNSNPANPFDSVLLNATGSWIVTPLNVGSNDKSNGSHKEESGAATADRLSSSVKLDKDSSQRNLHAQCEIQKWDDLVSAGYKNIRTNSVTSAKKKLVVWDGQRDQRDFLKEMAPATLGYGAEVVTWNGEKSVLDTVIESENKQMRKRHHSDEYNAELDQGRMKKFKKPKPDVYDGVNPFQEIQDRAEREKQARLNQFRNVNRPTTFE